MTTVTVWGMIGKRQEAPQLHVGEIIILTHFESGERDRERQARPHSFIDLSPWRCVTRRGAVLRVRIVAAEGWHEHPDKNY